MNNSPMSPEHPAAFQNEKPNKKRWVLLLGGCILLACLASGLIILFFIFLPEQPSYPLEGTVSFPPSVKQGDEFDFVLTLTNPGTEPIFIKHIVIHHDEDAPYLLDGATVLSTDPAMKSEPFAVGNDVQFLYFSEIEPGETQTVILHMQAENTGVYLANVGVYAKDPRLPEPAFLHAYHFFDAQMEIRPF